MNAALQAALSELFLDVIAAIGAVGPHVRSRVARIKNIFERDCQDFRVKAGFVTPT